MEGKKLSQRPAASSNFLGGRLADVAPAERARGVGAQPQVDALDVEQVPARRQQPHRLPVPHHGEADRALRPPGAGAGGAPPPAPVPAAGGGGGPSAVPAHGGGRVPVGEGAPEADGHREDDEAGCAGEADEHHRVAHTVAAAGGGNFQRVRRGGGGAVPVRRHGRAPGRRGAFVALLVGEAPQSGPP
ncbi:hypothetical protein SETIT_1G016800v2 [Setaria italica]|uniref:Uncharacterized protein n=1 Tax=Setaria italica TaxID=4555 RepID=A0A368PG47_SETIT|nr:hypothetical protein SETIT_1G016800v2 [Setaria italica]